MPQVLEQVLSRDFVFPGDVAQLPAARDAVMEFVGLYCAGEQQELDILLALQEALANAMLHGCGNDPGKLVRCTVQITPSEFSFVIEDPGPGFSSGDDSDTTGDEANLTEHGRGICIMRSLMDEVSYSNRGSRLEMKKLRGTS